MFEGLEGHFEKKFIIAPKAHYRVGGEIDLYAAPKTRIDCQKLIKRCVANNIPYFIFGKGANILISDEGFRGVFISLETCSSELELSNNGRAYIGAGIDLWELIQETINFEIGDMTNMSWIPGTVGGALYMNAGAFGTEIEEFVESVDVILPTGEFKTLSYSECGFQYRKSTGLQDTIILGARLKFSPSNKIEMRKNSDEIIARRKSKQPLEHPSCGSVFKRPPGLYAGTLIEECGLKDFSIGGARVSSKHANFILNENNATASDLYNVMKHVKTTVYEKKEVTLEREVKLIGFSHVDI